MCYAEISGGLKANTGAIHTTATLPLERLNPNRRLEEPTSFVLLQREQHEKFPPALPFSAFPPLSQENPVTGLRSSIRDDSACGTHGTEEPS